jgi:REP element-mobilizing transposase RayT
LDACSSGAAWLKEPDVAAIVKEALHYRDGKEYELLAYCVMPNHVHLFFSLSTPHDVHVGRLSSRPIETDAWAPGDGRAKARPTFVTDILHLINNPVKAGLVQSWEQWSWSYVKKTLL